MYRKTKKILLSKYFISSIVILTVTTMISLAIMSTLGHSNWELAYKVLRSIFELLYFSSGIVLIIGIYIGYKQLDIANKDIEIRNERMAVEKSLDYLDYFSGTLLPKMNKYIIDTQKEDPLVLENWYPEDNDYSLNIFEFESEDTHQQVRVLEGFILRQEHGLQDIFNHLEFFSAGIMHGLAKEDVVYPPISGLFCRFIKEEIIFLSSSRGQGSPYENLISLYKKWDKRINNDIKSLQIAETELKIEIAKQEVAADEESTKPKTPIGVSNN